MISAHAIQYGLIYQCAAGYAEAGSQYDAGFAQNNRRSQMLIYPHVQICRNLQMQLIVEELKQRQFDILKQLDCDGLQGYFNRPSDSVSMFEQEIL